MIDAAGILFISGGRVLLLRRAADSADYPAQWCFPGGKTEEGETAELTALRETLEETGFAPTSTLIPAAAKTLVTPTGEQVNFTTFIAIEAEQFVPILDHEHDAYVWLDFGQMPDDGLIHPGTLEDLTNPDIVKMRTSQMNETDVARAVATGALPSPQRFHNMTLFSLRITGTGTAYRTTDKEFTYRAPKNYMTPEFLARCNGLPVIFEHPEKAKLDSVEFKARNIGSIVLPFLREDLAEVWGVARIYDDEAIAILSDPEKPWSTSPTVVFKANGTNTEIELDDGSTLLIEGKPFLLDHVAVCEVGVWDKGGPPTGIELTNGVNPVDENEKAKADADAKAAADAANESPNAKMDAAIARMDAATARMDAVCTAAEEKAKADAAKKDSDGPTDDVADKAKKDADEKARADAEEKAKADSTIAAADSLVSKRLAEFEQRQPLQLTDDDRNALAVAQARADNIERAFGDSASHPMQGESPLAYRKRLANKLKTHSTEFAKVDISAIADETLFGVLESRIYADAQAATMRPATGGNEWSLREVFDVDRRTGRTTSKFVGDCKTWMAPFTAVRRMAKINPKAGVN